MRTRGIRILKESSVITTEPWGGVEQDSFANQVIEVETWLPAPILLENLLAIESEMGRVREVHWGPRLIDLDLLLWRTRSFIQMTLFCPSLHSGTPFCP